MEKPPTVWENESTKTEPSITQGGIPVEKKTIGKFIAVLRKASGMTQKELGDKLFVSDKTVSRWERDECTPELSLIPAIAELFGVTADELLRGERSAPGGAETTPRTGGKSEKQFKIMLHRCLTRFRNLSLISVGIGFLGLITALICNVGFTRAPLGFFLALAFLAAGVICQLCFASNALLRREEDDPYDSELQTANHQITRTTVTVLTVLCSMLAFCLPLAFVSPYWGLGFGAWILYGLLCVGVFLLLAHIADTLFLHKLLTDRDLLLDTAAEQAERARRKSLLKRTLLAALISSVLFGGGIVALGLSHPYRFAHPFEFHDYDTFAAFMQEASLAAWREDYGYKADQFTNPVNPLDPDGDGCDDFTWEDLPILNGEGRCQYLCYHDLLSRISQDEVDGAPYIRVYTQETMRLAYRTYNNILAALSWLLLLAVVTCFLIYAARACSKRALRNPLTVVFAVAVLFAAITVLAGFGAFSTEYIEPSTQVDVNVQIESSGIKTESLEPILP